ncbi:hypothetical protein ACI3EY_13910 [Ornithinimicrobium sp. LYQ92]|uniref:hypothetical protein n=1 Tax=Serinicoccus sp. LYQ92 TaxID=3378798 RepID=UPI0038539637
MDITQLLTGTAIILGLVLMTTLAVVPLWLERQAELADRPADRAASQTAPRQAALAPRRPRRTGNGPLRPGVA